MELTIEHVEPMSEEEAIETERRWHLLLENLQNRDAWEETVFADVQSLLTSRWFPYANNIKSFVEQLKSATLCDELYSGTERQSMLF
ncbi:hypothetical protein Q31b_33010 [Novipirellula aureliae]|uniref:Uncharacterized protein n=1 Tax=Novipirellula aureliae TaxID=2527966 RepID=A0A5C6DUK6_9BACT|nr:hypothetical protein [Novipirellula aureliae]TWU39985.1 hypothetical protein Q31b_33010 [Novipirellula aureliae]